MSCYACTPRECKPAYLYVMRDHLNGLTKIGCTVSLAQRAASYRANGNDHFERVYSRVAGCRWTGTAREAKALKMLAAEALRVRGDWFECDPALAISCVDDACAGYQGARWK